MTDARISWALHTYAGRLPVLAGSSWALDRTWAPAGAGTILVPLDAWDAALLDPLGRHHFILEFETATHVPTGTLAMTFAGSSNPAARWPLAGTRLLAPPAPLEVSREAWHVYLRGVEVDEVAGTAALEVSTFELILAETVNLTSAPWTPFPTYTDGDVMLQHAARQLFDYLGLDFRTEYDGGLYADAADIQPWTPGQSAWDWLDRLRSVAGAGIRVDPTSNRLAFTEPAPIADGVPPYHFPLLSLSRRYPGGGEVDGLEYAEALRVTWRWTDAAGESLESVETVTPDDWRGVRRVGELELPGPPIPGRAAKLLAELARWRGMAAFSFPARWPAITLGKGDAELWRSLAFDIGPDTVITGTIIVND